MRRSAGSRRERRRRAELQARLAGEFGPQWWQVLPAFAGLLLAVALPLYVLGWLWSRVGWWAALLLGAAAVWAGAAGRQRARSRAAARRSARVRFGLGEYDAADPAGQRRLVGRLLQRDGWLRVRGVWANDAGVVHLVGERSGGLRLGVAFDRGVEAGEGSRAALRPVTAAPDDPQDDGDGPAPVLVVVSGGTFSRERVVWAARSGVHLVDRALLGRWAAGACLAELLDLDLGEGTGGRGSGSKV
jgi:hypothetical protein